MYWGWNETPCDAGVDDPGNWDAIVIKLPPWHGSLCDTWNDSGPDDWDNARLRSKITELLDDSDSPTSWASYDKPIVILTETLFDFGQLDGWGPDEMWGYK